MLCSVREGDRDADDVAERVDVISRDSVDDDSAVSELDTDLVGSDVFEMRCTVPDPNDSDGNVGVVVTVGDALGMGESDNVLSFDLERLGVPVFLLRDPDASCESERDAVVVVDCEGDGVRMVKLNGWVLIVSVDSLERLGETEGGSVGVEDGSAVCEEDGDAPDRDCDAVTLDDAVTDLKE